MLENMLSWVGGILVLVYAVSTVIYNLWRFVRLFRRSCKWKGCPLQCREVPALSTPHGCTKCPYPLDQAEKKELDEELDRLENLIEDLKNKMGKTV